MFGENQSLLLVSAVMQASGSEEKEERHTGKEEETKQQEYITAVLPGSGDAHSHTLILSFFHSSIHYLHPCMCFILS